MRIFLAFMAEHMRAFPKEAVSMPCYMDSIIKMKESGLQWLKYDMVFRQKRGKRIARDSKKVGSWSRTDLVLYLECQHGRHAPKQQGANQRPYVGPSVTQARPQTPFTTTPVSLDAKPPPLL